MPRRRMLSLTNLRIMTRGMPRSPQRSYSYRGRHTQLSLLELGKLLLDKQFWLQCLCYATLAGVSFAVPGFQTTVLSNMDMSDKQAAWTNFAFIFSGVVTGLISGRVFEIRHFSTALKTFFCVASVALLGLTVLGWVQDSLTFTTNYALTVVLMAFAGGSTLGFIGIALAGINQTAHKAVHAEYSGGAVEWWLQVVGAVLTQVADACQSQAFLICGILVWTTTALMMTLYEQPFNKLDQEEGREPLVAQAPDSESESVEENSVSAKC
eukprot:TRINITY_DN12358_c0_g1_i1.p2 TRINITY_DN12358_c0_g1~~TRINITY_DN12358_c0_g1_i1.p2  ORF type:complete len:267 (+),score=46.15 TRINITY_DN12358_c0_g1_i1:643-1443(+)